jgi:sulfate transport system ATP-binding protein
VIQVSGVTKRFGDFDALRDVSLEVADGSLTALLGPSGSGKSTLLRVIAGLEAPDAGTVHIAGRDATTVPPQKRGIGFVFQHYAAFKHMTVRDNVAFGLTVRRRPKAEVSAKVDELLAIVGLDGYQGRYPAQLSGGQRQRMALARALAVEPEVLLLDEPFNGLDPVQRKAVIDLVRELGSSGHLVLLASHVLHEVESITDRVLLLREGKLLAEGTIRELRDHFEDVPRRIALRADDARRTAAALLLVEGTVGVRLLEGDRLEVSTRRADALLAHLTRAAAEGELALREITPEDEDLSSVFGMLEG